MKLAHRLFESGNPWLIRTPPVQLAQAMFGDVEHAEIPDPFKIENGIAVVPIKGVVVRTATAQECADYGLVAMDLFQQTLATLADDASVNAIVLDIDSPGGEACGTFEAATSIAGYQKPILSHTGGLMASAAYYLGSQALHVMATRSAMVGSIGVVMTTFDYTGMLAEWGIKAEVFQDGDLKTAGSPYKAMNQKERDYLQGMVEQIGADFRATVAAKMRNVPASAMQGQCFLAPSALENGLIHEITNLSGAIRAAEAIAKTSK